MIIKEQHVVETMTVVNVIISVLSSVLQVAWCMTGVTPSACFSSPCTVPLLQPSSLPANRFHESPTTATNFTDAFERFNALTEPGVPSAVDLSRSDPNALSSLKQPCRVQ